MRGVGDLAQVVRRDVGGHADGDAGRAVDQQVGQLGRQDARLHARAVVVLDEVDGLLVDVGEQLRRRSRSCALRCSASPPADRRRPSRSCPGRRPAGSAARKSCARRTSASYSATSPCGWYLPITSPTIAAHLRYAGRRGQAHLVHGVEDSAMDRLEAVADVGQRAADDDAHRVVEVAASAARPRCGRARRGPFGSVMRSSSRTARPAWRRRDRCSDSSPTTPRAEERGGGLRCRAGRQRRRGRRREHGELRANGPRQRRDRSGLSGVADDPGAVAVVASRPRVASAPEELARRRAGRPAAPRADRPARAFWTWSSASP